MKKRVSIILGVILCVILSGFILNQRLKAKVADRESTFISIYYLAIEALDEDYASRPKSIDELLAHYGGSESVLLEPFVDGLSYSVTESGFHLAEPVARRKSWFEDDRIVADENEWPHWEDSGEQATKHGAEIPERHLKK